MSKLNLTRCDGCGLVMGEDGQSDRKWMRIWLPSQFLNPSLSTVIKDELNYCWECAYPVSELFPKVIIRPVTIDLEKVDKNKARVR